MKSSGSPVGQKLKVRHQARSQLLKPAPSLPLQIFFTFIVAISLFLLVVQLMACGLAGNGEDVSASGGDPFNSVGDLAVGDSQVIHFGNNEAVLQFDNIDPNQRYLLGLTGGLSGSTFTLSTGEETNLLQAQPAVAKSTVVAAIDELDASEQAHMWFRAQEDNILLHPAAENLLLNDPAPVAAAAGSENFNVLVNTNGSYTTISTQLLTSGSHLNIYLDNSANVLFTPGEILLLDTTLEGLSNEMSQQFGEPSDINGNDRVDVVLTTLLSNFGNNSPLSGYFWAGDLQSKTQFPGSNGREVIFLIAPDTSSFYGGVIPITDVLERVLPGVFAHEVQHLLNFMHKTAPENPTINEAISHVIENWSGYPNELRYKQAECLKNFSVADLGNGGVDILTRGCAELLIQHICELKGDVGECLAAMINSSQTDWPNIEQVSGEPIGASIAKMLAGLYLTDHPTIVSASTLQYRLLGEGPAGDVTNFSPYAGYDDFRGTVMNGPFLDAAATSLPTTRTLTGFAQLFEVDPASFDGAQLKISLTPGDTFVPAGVLIRVTDKATTP